MLPIIKGLYCTLQVKNNGAVQTARSATFLIDQNVKTGFLDQSGSEFVVADTLAKWKKLKPNEIGCSQGLSQINKLFCI